jgi:hypothetical protein
MRGSVASIPGPQKRGTWGTPAGRRVVGGGGGGGGGGGLWGGGRGGGEGPPPLFVHCTAMVVEARFQPRTVRAGFSLPDGNSTVMVRVSLGRSET